MNANEAIDETKFNNTFSWSYSREQRFNQCLRGYYYEYYGKWKWWWADRKSSSYRLKVMSRLQTPATWLGMLVHEMINVILNNFAAFGYLRNDPYEILKRHVHNDWTSSLDVLVVDDPQGFTGLEEHFYHQPISEQVMEDTLTRAKEQLDEFLQLAFIEQIFHQKRYTLLETESKQQRSLDGIPVIVKIDLLLKDNAERYVVVDWKTGKNNQPEDAKLQMNTYGWYVAETYRVDPAQVSTVVVNFPNHSQQAYQPDHTTIKETKDHILSSAWEMKGRLFNPEENKARVRDFPRTSNSNKCAHCFYRGYCDPERYPNEWQRRYGSGG
jgi:CRISPR/Cas system-associated exonuclease Cas4 (RecB family)